MSRASNRQSGAGDQALELSPDHVLQHHAAGAGYGMQLVNMMVTQVGGALRVESGPGARFTLTAPAPSRAQVADDRMCIPS